MAAALLEVPARVARIYDLAPSVRGVQLLVDDIAPWLGSAGRYLEVILGGGKCSAFSLANAPSDDSLLEIHVRWSANSRVAEKIFGGQLRLGDTLALTGPNGRVSLETDAERPALMICGGTGFSQIKALVEHALQSGTRHLHIYRGARRVEDLYLDGLARSWTECHTRVHYTRVLQESDDRDSSVPIGLVHEIACASYREIPSSDIYLCGPPSMVAIARAELLKRGAAPERIHHD